MRPADEPLIDADRIAVRVRELAAVLSADFAGAEPILLAALKGSVYFAADLARAMSIPVVLEFIRAESYTGSDASGSVEFTAYPREPLTGRAILIVEDILDTGLTAQRIAEWVRSRAPQSVRLVTLLDKPEARTAPIQADYVGFTIPNAFVVGYGLDYDQRYRELPAIYRLTDDD